MNLLSVLLKTLMADGAISALAKKTGIGGAALKKLLPLAIPLLLKAMTNNASSQSGVQSLLGALTQHRSTKSMPEQIAEADQADGSKILGHILGGNLGNVVGALSQQTGVQQNQVQSLLGLIAPALLSGLSAATNHAQQQNSYDMSGLLSLFGGQPQQQQSGGLLSQLFGAPQQQQQTGGLLSQLLGGGQVQQQQQGGFLSQLFGAKPQQQVQQIDGTALLQALLALMK